MRVIDTLFAMEQFNFWFLFCLIKSNFERSLSEPTTKNVTINVIGGGVTKQWIEKNWKWFLRYFFFTLFAALIDWLEKNAFISDWERNTNDSGRCCGSFIITRWNRAHRTTNADAKRALSTKVPWIWFGYATKRFIASTKFMGISSQSSLSFDLVQCFQSGVHIMDVQFQHIGRLLATISAKNEYGATWVGTKAIRTCIGSAGTVSCSSSFIRLIEILFLLSVFLPFGIHNSWKKPWTIR